MPPFLEITTENHLLSHILVSLFPFLCLLSHVSCLTSLSHVFCLLSHISCFKSPTLVFYVSCLTTSVSCLTSRYCLTSPSTVSCLLFGGFVSCLTSPSNCLSHVFCLLSVSCLLAVSYLAHSPFCPTSTV